MNRRKFLLHGSTLSGLALGAGARPGALSARTLNDFDLSGALVPPEAIAQGGPPRDGIPAIDAPRFVAASASSLRDSDRVLGMALGETARAYPVRILNWHEIVNDRFEDAAVAITYCPLCGTGMAFDARVDGLDLRFGVSGLLYNSDMLMYDRATDSLWSQIMARALTGPMKWKTLTQLPLVHTAWADWRTRHPRTQVLSTETGHERDYGRDPYEGYDAVPRLMFEVAHRDDRLPPKEWVLGLRVGGEAKAYPFSLLERRVDARGRVADRIGGQRIEIRFDPLHRSAEAFGHDARPIPGVTAFWFAWFAFHPDTGVLR